MSEFKGTKGKWLVNRLDDTFINSENGKGVLCIQHNGCYDYKELPYNAQLISKAPELLEELKIAVKALKAVNSFGATKPIIERWENLIKESTTI